MIQPGKILSLTIRKLDSPERHHHAWVTKCIDHSFNESRLAKIVAFANPDQITFCQRVPLLPLTEHISGIFSIINSSDTLRETLDIRVDYRATVVTGAIIKNQNIDKRIGLRQDAVQTLRKIPRVIEVRHDRSYSHAGLDADTGAARRDDPV
ncbi:hypothetical protein D3C80_1366670 [compost metagenome]